jgi:glucose-1-phosphate cytidylyltransferase
MKIYSHYGVNDFIICCGYKGYIIKEYFANYFLHTSDITFDMSTNSMVVHQKYAEPWRVTVVDTGQQTMTGGRIKRVAPYLNGEEPFFLTYGDGVSDVNINELLNSHVNSKKLVTLTAVHPPGRFGALALDGDNVINFEEKPKGDGALVNGGFFVMSKRIFDFIEDDSTILERTPLERLAALRELNAYKHYGFWQAMDTLRDKNFLEELWASGRAPWRIWKS